MQSYISQFGSSILAPALAGTLYYVVGLTGILLIDLVTFAIASTTLACVKIPQPVYQDGEVGDRKFFRELTLGFRYIFQRPSLLAILIFLLSANLLGTAGGAIFSPMILARSGNDAAVLASVLTAAGLGGVLGGGILTVWGGPKRRIHGLLLGTALSSLHSIIIGLGLVVSVWLPASFLESFFSPFFGSSNQAIWLSKVEPSVQGRVFATRFFIAQSTSPIGLIIAGPLADFVFEPVMQPGGALAPIFGGLFGTGEGAGMALQYSSLALVTVFVSLGGYLFPVLRDVEALVPDHDLSQGSKPTTS